MTSKVYHEEEVKTLQKSFHEEKQCLLRIISTYGMLAESFPEYVHEVKRVKKLLQQESFPPLDLIEKTIMALRRQIFAKEVAGDTPMPPAENLVEIENLKLKLTDSLRMLRRVVYFFLEGFYPLEGELEEKAATIRIEVQPDIPMEAVERQVEIFTDYSVSLKQKISRDLLATNEIFLDLLKQIQQLEKVTQNELSIDARAREFESFEETIGEEMGAISRAFEFKKNIDELKTAVMKKIGNIKKIIARKKQTEAQQLKQANEKISRLRKKVAEVQADAREMFIKAEQFQQAALQDGLTGVHNRKSFELKLNQSISTLAQEEGILALIMIDVNRFKWINDTFGHIAGDKVLKVIADNLKKNFRKSDFVARYGGDEFVVLVDGLDVENIQSSIDRLKNRLKAIKFVSHTHKTNIKVEISAGLAMARPGDSCTTLLHRADQAMYEDKKNNTSSPSPDMAKE